MESRCDIPSGDLSAIIEQCRAHINALRDARILLTGATGWFGRWMLDALCALDDCASLGIRIYAVSRAPEPFCSSFPRFRGDSRIIWIQSDIRTLRSVDARFTHILHAAAATTDHGSDSPNLIFDTIVEGTRNALQIASRGCEAFLFVSSGAVYGRVSAGAKRLTESTFGVLDSSDPNYEYAKGKRAAEQLIAMAASDGVPARIARCFTFVGPHMPFDRQFAVGNFIADAVAGRQIVIKSDGRAHRSYLYMTDLLSALLNILVRGVTGRAYNVGSQRPISIKDLACLVNDMLGGAGVLVGGISSAGDNYVPDTRRVEVELGLSARVSLEEAIARTAAWYRARMITRND